MMSPERAQEIVKKAKAATNVGPWQDQLGKFITYDEDQEVKNLWSLMSGSTCYMDAFNRFLKGTAYSKETYDNAMQNVTAVHHYIEGYTNGLLEIEHTDQGTKELLRAFSILEETMKKLKFPY